MVLANFDTLLKKYAHLIAKVGVNVQKNDTVVVYASVDQAVLARLVTKRSLSIRRQKLLSNGMMMKFNGSF